MHHRLRFYLLFALSILSGITPAFAQEWTRFRGPNGTGESEVTSIPSSWTSKDYNWQIKLPGVGHSSPVLWGDHLFLMSADPETATRFLLCYDSATGRQFWERKFESSTYKLHAQSSYGSSTPAVDSELVYFAWAEPKSTILIALTHEGEVVWKVDLGTWSSQHGFGTSPIIVDDMVILSSSQETPDGRSSEQLPQSFVMAFDRKTGEERWRTPRKTAVTSYSVPAIFQPSNGPKQVVSLSTGDGMYALDAQSGTEIWSNLFFDKRTVSSPVVKKDFILGSTGSGGGGTYLVAARSDGKQATLAYKVDTQASYVPTVVLRGDLLFCVSDGGIASCLDLESGTVHWRKRIGGNYSSSPVRAGDKLFLIAMDGEVVVLSADKEFQELGRVPLGEGCRSTPAIANGRLYLRTFSQLMSIGGPAREPLRP